MRASKTRPELLSMLTSRLELLFARHANLERRSNGGCEVEDGDARDGPILARLARHPSLG